MTGMNKIKVPQAKIRPIESPRSGEAVRNQYEIETDKGFFFQSYSSVCAFWDGSRLTLGRDYDYSTTTRRWLYEWMRDHGIPGRVGFDLNAEGIRRAIASGSIAYDESMN